MKSKWMVMTLVAGALTFSGAAMAGDAAAGEKKAEVCLNCHEPAEDFAGQKAADIEAKIKAVVAGQHKHGKKLTLSDADAADIAAFFASAK
ncbi:MAG TPA: cytochrome c [Gammaproteobacteria bacterium]